jgi:hypothetical protein
MIVERPRCQNKDLPTILHETLKSVACFERSQDHGMGRTYHTCTPSRVKAVSPLAEYIRTVSGISINARASGRVSNPDCQDDRIEVSTVNEFFDNDEMEGMKLLSLHQFNQSIYCALQPLRLSRINLRQERCSVVYRQPCTEHQRQ